MDKLKGHPELDTFKEEVKGKHIRGMLDEIIFYAGITALSGSPNSDNGKKVNILKDEILQRIQRLQENHSTIDRR